MRHSMSKDTAFNAETTPRHTFLCSDSQCLPPGDPKILCVKHGYPITGKSFIKFYATLVTQSVFSSKHAKRRDYVMLQKNVCVGGIHNTFLIIFRLRKHEGKYNYEKVAILRTTFQYGNHYGQHSVWYQVFQGPLLWTS